MKTNSNLKGVPETMLWTLHNRATEAKRRDGIIKDDKAIEIYDSIDYDYVKSFGPGEYYHAVRSFLFDKEVSKFLHQFSGAHVVNLGDGLETQQFRLKDTPASWVSVDLPESNDIREKFINPDSNRTHLACSALDEAWMNNIPKNEPVFITAQGLFMYFNEKIVANLVAKICDTFNSGYIMFDTAPVWISDKTMSPNGWKKTSSYSTPKMPWGINRDDLQKIMLWSENITNIDDINFFAPRGMHKLIFDAWYRIPYAAKHAPSIVKIEFQRKK